MTDYNNQFIHDICWGAQGDLQVSCDKSFGEAGWNQPRKLPKNVYIMEDKRLYTFDDNLVTCPECQKHVSIKILTEFFQLCSYPKRSHKKI